MVTTERIRKIGADQLEDVVTIHDPVLFTRIGKPALRIQRRTDIRMQDYSCNDATHRDISGVKA